MGNEHSTRFVGSSFPFDFNFVWKVLKKKYSAIYVTCDFMLTVNLRSHSRLAIYCVARLLSMRDAGSCFRKVSMSVSLKHTPDCVHTFRY